MLSLWPIAYHLTTMFLCLFSLINSLAFHLLYFLLLLEQFYYILGKKKKHNQYTKIASKNHSSRNKKQLHASQIECLCRVPP